MYKKYNTEIIKLCKPISYLKTYSKYYLQILIAMDNSSNEDL